MGHAEYHQKDNEMPDCPICLITFASDDQIVVFSCDSKHYFHMKCGTEWLEVKTECPLCRTDFSEQIADFLAKSDDIRSEVAREAVSESGNSN